MVQGIDMNKWISKYECILGIWSSERPYCADKAVDLLCAVYCSTALHDARRLQPRSSIDDISWTWTCDIRHVRRACRMSHVDMSCVKHTVGWGSDVGTIKHVWSHNFQKFTKHHASSPHRARTTKVEKRGMEDIVSRGNHDNYGLSLHRD